MSFLSDYPTQDLKEISDAVEAVVMGNRSSNRIGLCSNVAYPIGCNAYDTWEAIRDTLFLDWPLSTGDPYCPVPDPSGLQPSTAYLHHENLYIGDYGKLRIELAWYIVGRIKENLEDR